MNKKSIWQKQLPTVLGLGVLVIALVIGVVTFTIGGGAGVFAPRATAQTTPKKIKITNVTDTGFTVSFFTEEATAGFVKYGTQANQLKSQSSDDRDQLSGTIGNFNVHHITVRGLQPNTQYYYLIGTGSNSTFDNQGSAFQIKTASRNGAPSAAKTTYGNVLNADGGPAEGAVVYLTINGVGEMSSLVKSSGSWAIPLSNARTVDGTGYAQIPANSQVSLQVQGNSESHTATLATTIEKSQPVTTMTLAAGGNVVADQADVETNDYQQEQYQATETEESMAMNQEEQMMADEELADNTNDEMGMDDMLDEDQDSASDSGELDQMLDEEEEASPAATIVDIESLEDQQVETTQPKIVGKAPANITINIEVHSDTQITQQITTASDGSFELDLAQLQETLEPGEHTVTITYIDPVSGEEVTKTQTFTVAQADTAEVPQTEEEDVPYGSGNPYPIDSSESGTASSSASPTPSPSPETISTDSGRTSMPATSSSLPVSGSVGTTMALVIGGIFFCLAGLWSFWIANEYKEVTIENKEY